jgi:gliding motility-associated-like protein
MKLKPTIIKISTLAFLLFFICTINAQTTLTLQPDAVLGKDAMLHGLPSLTNTNYGTNTEYQGAAWTYGGTFGITRGIVEFDLSSIPVGAVITSAQLSLFATGTTTGSGAHAGANAGWLSRITSTWTESTVTWNTAPTFTTTNQVALAASSNVNQDYLNIPVTNLLQDMVDNPCSSFGFIIRMQTEQTYRRLNFCSSDYSVATKRPMLVVTYTTATVTTGAINLGADTTLCPGQTLPLSVFVPASTYLWQDGSTNASYTVSQPGTYWVQATSCIGTFADTIVVSYNNTSLNLGNDTTLCAGQTLLLDATSSGGTYSWQNLSTNPTYTVSQTGTYWVNMINNGCLFSDSIDVIVTSPINVNLGNDTILCSGQNLLLDATQLNVSYLWQNGSTNATFLVNSPGIYWAQVSNACQTVTDSVTVSYVTLPTSFLGSDSTICAGQNLVLNATVPLASYTWQDLSTNSTFVVTQPGTYWVDVLLNGCSAVDTVVVTVQPSLVLNLGADTILCSGQNLLLNPIAQLANYLWSNNSTNNTLVLSNAGTYWLELTNACETISDTIQVNLLSPPLINLGADAFLCPGQTVQLNATSPNAIYQWQDNTTSAQFALSQPGTYWVNVTNFCGTTSDTIVFANGATPQVFIGNDTTLCFDKKLILSNANFAFNTYLWSTGDNTNSLSINAAGTYWLQATTGCGSSSDTIEIAYADCDCSIYVPNSFTPDGNEYNNVFVPVFKCSLFSYEFAIYNRWGEMIFQSNDYSIGWDGTYGGKIAQDGIFNYEVKYTTEDNINHVSRGHVNLLR